MISIDHLTIEFSAKALFTDVSYVVNDRDRIALVGKNGAGKSTMLKMIAGLERPTSGSIAIPRDATVGYLPQVMVLADGRTVTEEAETAFADIQAVQRRVEEIQEEMARRTDYETEDYMALCERFTHESERYRMMGGDNYRGEMERTLKGLGFEQRDLDRPTSEFSGGWRMRIELAKILLRHPDVLLLDEPTNHLDIESIQWFEKFLAGYDGAVMLVSHDRAFINNVTTRTIEITCGQIHDYKVKYDEYLTLRAERREQQLRAYENQRREIEEAQAFIERFRYQATKAVQVQQKVRQLEKIVPIEVDEVDTSALRLKFTCSQRSGDFPVICDEVRKDYDRTVFDHVNLTIRRGEKVAFVGRNGEGKSTLVKCILGEIPFQGTLKVGHNVEIGYFAQNQAQLLDGELTVFETIDRVARGDIRLKIRDILGAFMFGGEASDKKVKVLSGGERTRLAMIKLLLEPVNCLILDEPTNHLDLKSKDVLKSAIKAFDGTVIIVSHDRDFLDGLVERVYEFGGGRVREYLGGIYDWIRQHEAQQAEIAFHQGGTATAQKAAAPAAAEAPKAARTLSYEEQKAQAREQRKKEKAIKEAEEQMSQLEQAVKILEARMATPEGSGDASLYEKHAALKSQLEQAEEKWLELCE